MTMILHIAQKAEWRKALLNGEYAADSLVTQGFIHCSTPAQVIPVANRLFKGRDDLVLLCIDSSLLAAAIRYENLEGGDDLYPHIYGCIETEAVVQACDFPAGADGTFELPADIRTF